MKVRTFPSPPAENGRREALSLFADMARANPDDPLVAFYAERFAQGETGTKIKMVEK